MGRSWSTVAAFCGLMLAGCGGGTAADPAALQRRIPTDPAVAGFAVPSSAPTTAPELALPVKRTKGCVMVRQNNATGERACVPKIEVCKAGGVWWTRDTDSVCGGPLRPESIRVVSAPPELPLGAALCVVWAGAPSKLREAVLVVASAHANCRTGLVGAVVGPPADPLSAAFPATRPDCGVHYPGTRRAWPAKVTFVDPPGKAWACLIG
ncbi:MAG: hypothetical protein ACT4QF_23480 [Sporichthyaceae bacterium]